MMRNRDIALNDWFGKVSRKLFEIKPEKWILGVYPMQENKFKEHLHSYTKQTLLSTDSFSYCNENGVLELLDKCSDKIANIEYLRKKRIVEELERMLAKNDPRIIYGLRNASENGISHGYYSESSHKEKEKLHDMKWVYPVEDLTGFPLVDSLKFIGIKFY